MLRRTKWSRNESGLSLIEVMVAMGVFAIGSLSLLSVLMSSSSNTFDNRARVVAANLAASDIDEARATPYDMLGSATRTESVDGRTYTIVRDVQAFSASGGSACITNGGLREREKRVSTRVTTQFKGVTKDVRADTVVGAPVFDPKSLRGAIGFQVLDRNGAPKPGLNVTVQSTVIPTDSNGCAFFSNLVPGSHDVTVAWANAVTMAGSTDLRRTLLVVQGQITTGSIRVDRATTVTVDSRVFGNSTSNTFQFPTGLAVEMATPMRTGPTRVVPAKPVTGSPLVFSVFPEVGGYGTYFTRCTPSLPTLTEPATSVNLELPLSPVTLVMSTQNNSMNPGAQDRSVEVTWRPVTGTCTETLTYTTRTGTSCIGSTNPDSTSACRIFIAVPAGNWRFKATGVNFYEDATIVSKTAKQVVISW